MAIKTIPLSRLETELTKTLYECAESGDTVVVEMPDQRLLAIQPPVCRGNRPLSRRDHVTGARKMHDDLADLRIGPADRDLLDRQRDDLAGDLGLHRLIGDFVDVHQLGKTRAEPFQIRLARQRRSATPR